MGPGPRFVGPQDPGTWDPGPPQSLKVGPGTPLKFKSGIPQDSVQNLKVGPQDPL